MPAAVQTKSRANRKKLFKKFYRHSTPNFRCYHGSRLPPKASFEGMWKHSKFLSSNIKWGKAKKEKGKPPKLLEKKLKALPQKRKKRGILTKTETGKKPTVIKQLKPRKRVSFGKKKSYYKRQEQKEMLYDPGDRPYGYEPIAPVVARARTPAQIARMAARKIGSRGDPKTTFRVDAQGRLVQVARKRGRIRIV